VALKHVLSDLYLGVIVTTNHKRPVQFLYVTWLTETETIETCNFVKRLFNSTGFMHCGISSASIGGNSFKLTQYHV
jgi:hypothetical protein